MSHTVSTHTCHVDLVALTARVVVLAHDDADGAHGPARFRWTFEVHPNGYDVRRQLAALDAGEMVVSAEAECWLTSRSEWRGCDLTGRLGNVAKEYAAAKRSATRLALEALRTAQRESTPASLVQDAYVAQLRRCLDLGDRLRSVDGDLDPGDTPWTGDEVLEQIARGSREEQARAAYAKLEALAELAERLQIDVRQLRDAEREKHRVHREAERRDKLVAESDATLAAAGETP
jgi:hypothetical protein